MLVIIQKMFGRIALRSFCEEEEINSERIMRRQLRDASNPLELQPLLFKQHYIVSKPVFKYLLEVLQKSIPEGKKAFSVPIIIKLSACLRFFAEGGYQKGVGRDKDVALAQSTFSTVLSEVLLVLERKLCPKWIFWPTDEEMTQIKQDFYKNFKIPGVVGSVDGIHVQIIPQTTNRHLYYNRKGNYSLNVMLVCDHKLRIMYVDATHPGACHDASIWNTSVCREQLKKDYCNGVRNTWLLGDAGYPLEPWIMTPYRIPQPDSREMNYNDIQAKARNGIERTNGVLKNRWRCLLAARELYYAPEKVVRIVNVCCALHNICIAYNRKFDFQDQLQIPNTGTSNSLDEETPLIQNFDNDTFSREAQRIRINLTNAL